jgi:hypothetical protein
VLKGTEEKEASSTAGEVKMAQPCLRPRPPFEPLPRLSLCRLGLSVIFHFSISADYSVFLAVSSSLLFIRARTRWLLLFVGDLAITF